MILTWGLSNGCLHKEYIPIHMVVNSKVYGQNDCKPTNVCAACLIVNSYWADMG